MLSSDHGLHAFRLSLSMEFVDDVVTPRRNSPLDGRSFCIGRGSVVAFNEIVFRGHGECAEMSAYSFDVVHVARESCVVPVKPGEEYAFLFLVDDAYDGRDIPSEDSHVLGPGTGHDDSMEAAERLVYSDGAFLASRDAREGVVESLHGKPELLGFRGGEGSAA